MDIEPYSERYADDVRSLILEFFKEALEEFGIAFNEQALNSTIDLLKNQAIDGGYTGGFLAIQDGKACGLIAGKDVKTPWANERIWHEVVWFMSEPYRKYGVKLLKETRKKLKEEGFSAMVMVHMANSKPDKIARLYEVLGFRPMETNYIGRL